jgi:hypothetical protein
MATVVPPRMPPGEALGEELLFTTLQGLGPRRQDFGGMERDCVAILGFLDLGDEDLANRLLYVGQWRANQRLYVIGPASGQEPHCN